MGTRSDVSAVDGQTPREFPPPLVVERWAAFQTARAELAAVMSDDELQRFGVNVEVLDEEP